MITTRSMRTSPVLAPLALYSQKIDLSTENSKSYEVCTKANSVKFVKFEPSFGKLHGLISILKDAADKRQWH